MRKLSSPQIWAILLVLYIVICLFRIWYSLFFAGPQSLGDAAAYDYIAQTFIDGTFISSGAYANTYPPGYPLLLTISYLFGPDKIIIYHAQLVLNALVAGTVLFPVYLFLRDWCTKELALCGAVLIATLPVISKTTSLIMSESLFIPLIMFTIYIIYKSFLTDNIYLATFAGFLAFLSFLTRSTGLAILIALVFGLFWYCYLHQKEGIPFVTALRKKWGILAGVFIPLAIWEIFLIINKKPAIGYQPETLVSSFIQGAQNNIFDHFRIFILQIDYVLLTTYIIGAVIAVYVIYLLFFQPKNITKFLMGKEDINRAIALRGITGVALVLFLLLALLPLPMITTNLPYMYGRFYDPIVTCLFLFTIIGIQYLFSRRKIPKSHTYGIFLASISAAGIVALTLPWNSHLDVLQNASLPYLYLLPIPIGTAIILILFGIILPVLFLFGITRKRIMYSTLILLIGINIIMSIPMIQTETQFSHNFDNVGSVGKYIQSNIDKNAEILWDDGIFDPMWSHFFKVLVDYWITNDLKSVNLTDIAASGDYSSIHDGDYIITALPGNTEPIYTTPAGISLYHL